MKTESPYENMVNLYHDNPSMMELYEYRNSEIYREIVLFLNDFNADWRKKKELGEYAADFILRIIKEFEEDDDDESSVQWLTNIYEEIADRYSMTKSNYQFARLYDIESFFKEFKWKECIDETQGVDFEEACQKYQKDDDEKICLSF